VHTSIVAQQALQWVQMFDLWSLWLCSVCPLGGEQVSQWPEPLTLSDQWPVAKELQAVRRGSDHQQEFCVVHVRPWPFTEAEIALEANAWRVPQQHYTDPSELLAARTGETARWVMKGIYDV